MPRKKQIKLDEVKVLPNVFSSADEYVTDKIKDHFGGREKYTLELGCGNGDYTLGLARLFPEKNFIGVDRKGNRIWTGAKNALAEGAGKTAFLISAIERLDKVFRQNSVEEIWITFPDPFPRRNSMHKRLVYPTFLDIYRKIIVKGAKINLKTDDDTLYLYALQVVKENNFKLYKESRNLYNGEELSPEESIQTKYEKNHLKEGKIIKLVSFSIT